MGTQKVNTNHSGDGTTVTLGLLQLTIKFPLIFRNLSLQHRNGMEWLLGKEAGRIKESTARTLHPPCFSQALCENETCAAPAPAPEIFFSKTSLDDALKKAFIDSLNLIGSTANRAEPGVLR